MKKKLEQTWRWYGPEDSVSLADIKQAGASGVVSALHHIKHGEIWPIEEIKFRKQEIEAHGLTWSVVESVPVHEDLKLRTGNFEKYLENYIKTLENLASCGIFTICYNFMPVLDWTRTQLDLVMKNGAKALHFNWIDLAVFDIFVLKRSGAEDAYSAEIVEQARKKHHQYTTNDLKKLSKVVLMGIPGEQDTLPEELLLKIEQYKNVGLGGLRENLIYFLQGISEVCTRQNIKMTIHPDDPPFPILGLPRVVSTFEDFDFILNAVNMPFNGVCFCTGSLGAGSAKDIPRIFARVKDRVYFAHLRNVKKYSTASFYEADHLDGDVNMYQVMNLLTQENQLREKPIPFRPDHGHQMLDDLSKGTNPGYSAIGRLRGLAELRGLEMGILGE